MKLRMPTERQRAYLYRVLTAAGTVAVYYGVSAQEVAVWLTALGVVLGSGLATANTSTQKGDHEA